MGVPRVDKRNTVGILLLDKPPGVTSNRALQRAKGLFAAAKAGHAGSLDPLATGMLPIGFGAATRLTHFLLGSNKTYRVTALLGVATNTGDADGVAKARAAVPDLCVADIGATARLLTGEIEQLPPMYSALKHRGRRLYELARQGLEVERAPRRVHILEIGEIAYEAPQLTFTVRCSKGTYVRTLVEDLAVQLGTVGHVTSLRRLEVEPFGGYRMYSLAELEQARAAASPEALDGFLLPMQSALAGWPSVEVTADQARRLIQGQSVGAGANAAPGEVCIFGPGHRFVGVGEIDATAQLLPRRILDRLEPGDCANVQVQ